MKQLHKIDIVTSAQRCLIVAPSWVGDMVMAQSLFRRLKQLNPQLVIDVFAPAWCGALTQYMPEVSQLIEAPFQHGKISLASRRKFGRELRGKYDIAFVLPNSLKSALVPWFAKIPARFGFLGEQRYGLLNQHKRLDKQLLPTMTQRFVALADLDGDVPQVDDILPPKLVVDVKNCDEAKFKKNLDQSKSILALCPGAEFGPAKQWPSEHYAAVARFYLDKGWQVWLFGSEKDQATCQEINAKSKSACQDLSGKTSLAEAITLLSLSDLVVSNDSGLMHIAAALHKPLVAVYGSTDPSFTPPLNEQAKVVRLGLDCSPCFKRECPLQHLNCLNDLKPKMVLQATKALLNEATT